MIDPAESQNNAVPVSIIIPAYNAAATIADTLNSILAQTCPDWEAIVVDDGSTDATCKVVKGFIERDPRICILRQPNGGEAAARNTGITKARYDWLLFLDADDWISPLHLERMTNELRANPKLDAVHCGYARVAGDGTHIVDNYEPPTGDLFPTLARRAAFPVHACIVRKSLVEEVGSFDSSFRTSPDWDLWQRVARTGARFGAVREVLAFYRMTPSGASLDAYQLLKDDLHVLKQGHSEDKRVRNAKAEHANGSPPDGIQTQEYYLLSWCAGLLLGGGKDALPLLEMVRDDHCPDLFPDAVAQCIFESAILPNCLSPWGWERLWLDIHQNLESFLIALEKQSMTQDLARRTSSILRTLILKHSPSWSGIIGELERSRMLLEEQSVSWQQLAEHRQHIIDAQKDSIENLKQAKTELQQTKTRVEQECGRLQKQLKQETAERNEILYSHERRFGDLLLNRLRLRAPLLAAEYALAAIHQRFTLTKLAAESRFFAAAKCNRVVATICDVFPIYSQTFVYQELTQLSRQDFDVRLVYSKLDSREYLSTQFSDLWKVKRRLFLNPSVHERDFARYQARMPDRVESLIQKLCESSGMARQDLFQHGNFLQAFSFTRMVEAYRPQYLHSYFFYDRSLMALVAGYLLDIPRGVSCYADHLLKDYELKVVPLHMELCSIIIATSERIKRELLEIAPRTDPSRILVKPNGIDTDCFPVMQRIEPVEGVPFRLVSVCRIEPKKGLIDLVEAVGLLRQRGLQVEAHLVGTVDEWSQASCDYKRLLDQRISELDLWGKIHLEGRQNLDGVRRFLGIAQLFVAPFVETEEGDKDGIPTALLEGMATGLPAVATDAGSIPEVIEDGRDGVLVSQHDPVALADAIDLLLRHPERRRRLSREAADKVRRRFDVRISETIFHERVRKVATSC